MYWKRLSKQRMFPWIACYSRHGSLNTSERRRTFQESVSSSSTENRTMTMLVVLLLFHVDFSHAFLCTFFMLFIHICRAFLCITKMRFHCQLMRFHKTAVDLQQSTRHRGALPERHRWTVTPSFNYRVRWGTSSQWSRCVKARSNLWVPLTTRAAAFGTLRRRSVVAFDDPASTAL